MTWQGKRRKQLPSNWNSIRRAVLERDGYRCTAAADNGVSGMVRCVADATDVHHANGPHDHRLSSLRSLCGPHHDAITQAEAKAAQALKSRARAKQPHPGLR